MLMYKEINDEKLKKTYSRSNRTWNNLFSYIKCLFDFQIDSNHECDNRYSNFDKLFLSKYKN